MPKEKSEQENAVPKGEHGRIWAEWLFDEYPQHERNRVWYFWFIVIVAGLIVYAILANNPLFAVIIFMVAFIIFFQGRKQPNQIKFQITEDGLILDDKIYEYNRIGQFWIIYNPPDVKELFFDFKNSLRPEMSIPLQNMNPVRIREFLLKYLKEDLTKEHEGFSRGARRLLKF